ILMIAALVVCTSHVALAQNVAGDWQAILKIGPVELRLVLHIAQGNSGALKATLDSVDLGRNGIPVTSIVPSQWKLRFTVDSVNGSYEETVNVETTTISGTWSQGQPLPLDFKRAATTAKAERRAAKPSAIDGAWIGTVKLRIVFHVTNTEDGVAATM